MIVTTTHSIEGRRVRDYLGVVTGEAVLGANIFRDIFAGIRDIVGGRSGSYEKELRRAREVAFQELESEARDKGADAIIGVDLDYALHRYYLWARQIGIYLGSGSWQLARLGEMLASR